MKKEVFWQSKQPDEDEVEKAKPAVRNYELEISIILEDSSRSELYQQDNAFIKMLLKSAQNGEIQAYEPIKTGDDHLVGIDKTEVMEKIRKPMIKDYNSILFNQISNWIEKGNPAVVLEEEYQPEGTILLKSLRS